MSKKSLLSSAESYVATQGLELTGSLGNGLDGNIWKVRSKKKRISWALKIHAEWRGYRCERDCYQKLLEHQVSEIEGFHVRVMVRTDDQWLAIEMSIVERPFILDFAQAFLDIEPEFPEEVWQERLETWSENYGEHWPRVQRALYELEGIGIYYLDVHHQNVSVAVAD
ncbi:hypothetical protein FEM03_21025 [Phragmitibacter flavus]|uniref:Aminoglycoside phosphotransferase domain-containing protein n=1 Tax=Phragmitibacter flavus TaxID=2576071 RepID=A0A5R8K935_9BACT|nr:hypothetical protein [Phragmitibacter flavus]TLD68818.1 hypothetical protein FEM03_21025 [Phragmitibacter flavus]